MPDASRTLRGGADRPQSVEAHSHDTGSGPEFAHQSSQLLRQAGDSTAQSSRPTNCKHLISMYLSSFVFSQQACFICLLSSNTSMLHWNRTGSRRSTDRASADNVAIHYGEERHAHNAADVTRLYSALRQMLEASWPETSLETT